ncbi:MAG: metalloregulator ArsR/SmtB family transcription factor [bacterium]|nr:metalloregulator ArsR/SmtB family transcription factor [bacterium]
MNELERNLKALANKRRLAILKYLKRVGKSSVGDVAGEIRLSFKATSRHLAVLTNAGILEKEQEGLTMWHQISPRKHSIVANVIKLL